MTSENELAEELLRRTAERLAQLQRLPESTYRLQFHAGFTFRDATAIVPYLARLGITHVYASPYLRARPGSTHGYDVIDHGKLNPELGTQADYDAFVAALSENGLSQILDTVPNHVGVGTNDNAWWNDVLENGPESKYASYFDISWRGSGQSELHDRVFLPLLGDQYATVLERGELQLQANERGYAVHYFDRWFPISRKTHHLIGDLKALLARQNYQLAYWKAGADELNYRRFFDVNDLAALSQEREEVFEATHQFTLKLAAEGKLSGLRIDHPDGLYDPREYLDRLQAHYVAAVAREVARELSTSAGLELSEIKRLAERRPLYAVVEKIVAADESLPRNWATHGTSGYDFLIKVNSLFVDTRNAEAMSRIYDEHIGTTSDFESLAYEKKKFILALSFSSEWNRLTRQLGDIAQSTRQGRDFTSAELRLALGEVIACFAVYRTYITGAGDIDAVDRLRIDEAVDRAIVLNPKADRMPFDFIRQTLFSEAGDARRFAGKFQQLTSPVMAKGIEDTAFYIYNRLISLNEVGGDPSRFGITPAELHDYFKDRQANWPYALSCLSTHDTKRSEDVRARLNVISELPDEWRTCLRESVAANAPQKLVVRGEAVPSSNDEYLIYQTLLGAWPFDSQWNGERSTFIERIQAYMLKAMREAKVHTRWTDPDEEYEKATATFIERILDERTGEPFFHAFNPFRRRATQLGLLNGLSQTLLRLTAPGVPDTYQGTELWDFSLVDPDNRRPVDYATRRTLLEEQLPLFGNLEDGRLKLHITSKVLACRREHPGLFSTGEYVPLEVAGSSREHVFAFLRRTGDKAAVVVVPRFMAGLVERASAWADTRLILPADVSTSFVNVLSGSRVEAASQKLKLEDLLSELPVGLFISAQGPM